MIISEETKRALLIAIDAYRLREGLTWARLGDLCSLGGATLFNAVKRGKVSDRLYVYRLLPAFGFLCAEGAQSGRGGQCGDLRVNDGASVSADAPGCGAGVSRA